MRTVRHMLLVLVVVVALMPLAGRSAWAVDVSNLSDFEADPCVIGLGERNTAQNVGAPDSALVSACDRAHGNVEVAWDFLTRTWRPPSVPMGPAAAGPLYFGGVVIGIVQMLLAYVVLGGPLRGLAVFLRPRAGVPTAPRWLAIEAGLCLVLRLLLGTLLLRLLALPFTVALGGVLVLLAVIAALRWTRRRPVAGQAGDVSAPPASRAAELIAGVANDATARAAGLLALALLARGDWRLLVLGVLLAVVFSLPQVVDAVRLARGSLLGVAILGIVLALSAGALGGRDAGLVRMLGASTATVAVGAALLFAALAAWLGAGLATRLRPRGRLPSSRLRGG